MLFEWGRSSGSHPCRAVTPGHSTHVPAGVCLPKEKRWGRGGGCARLCVRWVRPGMDTASQLEKGCRKIGEGLGIWETAFEWEAEASPCLFSLSQARLGCESIAVSTYLHGEGISFSQKCLMKPSGQGLEWVSYHRRNLSGAGGALRPPPWTAEGLSTASPKVRSLSLGAVMLSRAPQHHAPSAWGKGFCA